MLDCERAEQEVIAQWVYVAFDYMAIFKYTNLPFMDAMLVVIVLGN